MSRLMASAIVVLIAIGVVRRIFRPDVTYRVDYRLVDRDFTLEPDPYLFREN